VKTIFTVSGEALPALWQAVLEKMPPILAREVGRAGLPAISGPNALVLRFPLDYNAARQYIEQSGNVARVETLLQSLTGVKCSLRLETAGGQLSSPKAQATEDAAPAQSPYRRKQAEALKEPLVRKAIERMGAQILEVDEGFGSVTAPASDKSDEAITEDD